MAFYTAKFDYLPRNYREIRYFYREITAKLTILQFRGTAKLGLNYRAKYRPLPPTKDRQDTAAGSDTQSL